MAEIDKFYKAVADYIEANGGKAIVVGGTTVETRADRYRLVVDFTGKPPSSSVECDTEDSDA